MLAVGLGTTWRRFLWKLQIYQQQYVHLDNLHYENPSEYLTIFICLQSRYAFSKKPLVLRNGCLQSTMDATNSSDFVIRLNKYLFTCDGNSFQNNQNMVLGTLSYVIAAWYVMQDVRCTMQAEENDARSVNDTQSMIAHDTPYAFKMVRCTVFKRNWCTLAGVIGQCCSDLRKNAT